MSRRYTYRQIGPRQGRHVPPVDPFVFCALASVPDHHMPEAFAELRRYEELRAAGRAGPAERDACLRALKALR